jgi:microcystin-dependent protein
MDAYIGEIRAFPYSYVPLGWIACEGQQLLMVSYQALYALLGSTYGPATNTTFYLPDLRGASAIGQGQGAGLSDRVLGENGGAKTVPLLNINLPQHSHALGSSMTSTLGCASGQAALPSPVGNIEAAQVDSALAQYVDIAPELSMNAGTVVIFGNTAPVTGNSTPHENLMPALVFRYCICNDGVYPIRPD